MKKTVLPFQSRYKAHERQDSRTIPLSAPSPCLPLVWNRPLVCPCLRPCLRNELLLASLFTTDNVRTLTVGIKQMSGQYQTDYGSMGAGLVISTLPTLVLYMCMSSLVQRSLVDGAVKG